MEEKVDLKIREMLSSDVIEPVVGPPDWISPMVVVPKGSSNISDILSRLCPPYDASFDEESEHYVCSIGDEYNAITLSEIRSETSKDETLRAVMEAITNQCWPHNLPHYQAFSKELGIIDGVVVRNDRIVLPIGLRPRALSIAHRGHPGVVSMRRNLREKLWWPYMDRDIGDRIQECAGCAAVSSQGPAEPMIRKEMPDHPWQEIAIDFFSAKECATFLVIVDYYSRFLKVIEMKNTTAVKTIEALEEVFVEQSYPESIRCDNGPPFSSEEFSTYCARKNIRLVRTIPYWPQMNGLVERQNQGILRALRISRAMNADWRAAVKTYVHMYNTTPHTITGKAPMVLLTGRPVKDLLPSLKTDPYWNRNEVIRDRDAIEKFKGKTYADNRRHAKLSGIVEGDTVLLRNYATGKLEPNFRPEKFTVIKKNGNETVVTNEEGVKYRRPVSHLKKWIKPHADTPHNLLWNNRSDKLQFPCIALAGTSINKDNGTKQNTDGGKGCVSERPRRTRKLPARLIMVKLEEAECEEMELLYRSQETWKFSTLNESRNGPVP
ncbi:uncharacterized protein K02A2.6-like [Malaya genurostris]|uniref:uncharacterized protein K02A2.6-like n=1 Tax=Malaya genurostris TaxID=325434 RepID=UPI0026F3BACB|nr:uncharacterized protein K02A2.6-like [Malaya genurostris]